MEYIYVITAEDGHAPPQPDGTQPIREREIIFGDGADDVAQAMATRHPNCLINITEYQMLDKGFWHRDLEDILWDEGRGWM